NKTRSTCQMLIQQRAFARAFNLKSVATLRNTATQTSQVKSSHSSVREFGAAFVGANGARGLYDVGGGPGARSLHRDEPVVFKNCTKIARYLDPAHYL